MNNALTVSKEHAGDDVREMIFATCVSDVASNEVFHDEVKEIELSARDYVKVVETLQNPPPLNEAMKRTLEQRLVDMYVPEK